MDDPSSKTVCCRMKKRKKKKICRYRSELIVKSIIMSSLLKDNPYVALAQTPKLYVFAPVCGLSSYLIWRRSIAYVVKSWDRVRRNMAYVIMSANANRFRPSSVKNESQR